MQARPGEVYSRCSVVHSADEELRSSAVVELRSEEAQVKSQHSHLALFSGVVISMQKFAISYKTHVCQAQLESTSNVFGACLITHQSVLSLGTSQVSVMLALHASGLHAPSQVQPPCHSVCG
jgi:hypothetical protein